MSSDTCFHFVYLTPPQNAGGAEADGAWPCPLHLSQMLSQKGVDSLKDTDWQMDRIFVYTWK